MKKNIIAFASLLAASLLLVPSCQKTEIQQSVPENATVSSLTVNATIQGASGEGMKTVISASDVLRVRFEDASGKLCGVPQTLLNTTGEGASATFHTDEAFIPTGASKMVAYLDDRATCKINYASNPLKADFSSQDGTLSGAQALQIISGEASVGSSASVNLTYKTTIVKAVASYPEGITPVSGETTLTLVAGEYNTVALEDDSANTKGNITVNAIVDAAAKTATAYFAVLASDLVDGVVSSKIGSVTYGFDIEAGGIQAGKLASLNGTTEVMVYSFKYDSESQTIDGVNGTVASGVDWITLQGGKLVVAANNSGSYRKGSVVMSTGKTYNVEQAQYKVADFLGTYSFYSYTFYAFYSTENPAPLGYTFKVNQGNREHRTTVQFVAAENPAELNGHVHNADLIGLYKGFKLPVSIEFSEDGPSMLTYLSLDYQDLGADGLVAGIPELTNNTSYGTGYFAPTSFGPDGCNYAWTGWGVDINNQRFTLGTGDQRLVSDSRWFCGFSFVKKGYAEGKYTTIYQLNYKNKWVFNIDTGGAYFVKE